MKHLVLSDPSISQRLFRDILANPTSPREALDYPKIQRMQVFIGLNLVSL
jgi:hypothetical protein